MPHHTALRTHREELYENVEDTEAQNCSCSIKGSEGNTPTICRMHHFQSPRLLRRQRPNQDMHYQALLLKHY